MLKILGWLMAHLGRPLSPEPDQRLTESPRGHRGPLSSEEQTERITIGAGPWITVNSRTFPVPLLSRPFSTSHSLH